MPSLPASACCCACFLLQPVLRCGSGAKVWLSARSSVGAVAAQPVLSLAREALRNGAPERDTPIGRPTQIWIAGHRRAHGGAGAPH
ncbi:hypothetical protein GQ53DRAFT_743613 [Thozetella sp. PMI_491]|nr:hypothetical protein GQ53DRAFT_743613 [Thozetella sp. PMI_491]